ncbi:MAG: exodeoxyribonuclease VII large subunit [Minisyncoccia bacterium]
MSELEIIPVSQYLDKINNTLKGERAKIIGEVFDFKMSEAWTFFYFSIKDKQDGSILQCIILKNDYRISGIKLADGVEIVITGFPGVYKQKGEMKFRAELIELVGEGALKLAYEKLKKKLELEGLFSDERKREIPNFPHRIGLITSKSGAVIHDFDTNLGKFGFEILFVDSKVEGQDAIKDLLSAVNTLKDKDLDVLVIIRGGGSLEALMAFNNENLVRAIANFPTPVLTGIGHDKDAPLVSMVSDKNVSTPTAVANLLNSSWNEARAEVRLSEEKIMSQFLNLLETWKRAEETLLRAVDRIESGITRMGDLIIVQTKELVRSFTLFLENTGEFITQSGKSIELSSPERQLAHGYSIVRHKGKVLKSVKNIKKGDLLDTMLSDGTIQSQII